MDTSSKRRSDMVIGLFHDCDSAELALQAVSDRGYDIGDLNLAMSGETWQEYVSTPEDAGHGGMLGSALAALTAAGAVMALPALGLVFAGPLAAAAASGASGGAPDVLTGWGIPAERVKRYENVLKEGSILMGVQPYSEEDTLHFEERWRRHSRRQLSPHAPAGMRSDAERYRPRHPCP
ncbi:MAG TPA: hypothetical protein VF427_13310 [Noviherbaspirillum sp.]